MKWPRFYVDEIMRLPTNAERREALERVPEPQKEIVRTHLNIEMMWWKHEQAKRIRLHSKKP